MWDNCIRCGSNRVIRKRAIFIPLFIIVFGMSVASLGGVYKEFSYIFSSIGIIFIAFGILILAKSKLYCKDCELKWRPSKDKKINV
ncbi:hypothetical protein ACQKP0_25470 [Heyndrickxia sp. NPDC080065]|uniref:hypothetical protein n=1 Tax=Heyndrickxia sp. NPDC080065 TaxID=3390568 RepID=UPI003CFFE10F